MPFTGALDRPWVYRLWMSPFADQKFRPILASGEVERASSVLDVGCGPGTNAGLFTHCDYVGIDINPAYTASARQRHGRRFVTGDVTDPGTIPGERFDFILLNSLLHHLDTTAAARLLASLPDRLTAEGQVHVLELIRPEQRSVARSLARHDRGRYARSLEEWRELLGASLSPTHVETYSVGVPGCTLWHMLYFRGQAR